MRFKYPGIILLWLLVLFPGFDIYATPFSAKSPSIEYYGEIGCSHCDLFVEKILPEAEKKAGLKVEAVYYDILSRDGYSRCETELEKRGFIFRIFPVLIIGNNVYQGNSEVEDNLPAELGYYAEQGEYRSRVTTNQTPDTVPALRMDVVPVIFAGLIDGINPCAFATMLFFISWIAVKGGGRRRILLCGISFIVGVYLAYLAIGFGLLGFIRTASGLEVIRRVMRYVLSLFALILGLLSITDAFYTVLGKKGRVILQLPKTLKLRIHAVIRHTPGIKDGLTFRLAFSFAFTGIIVALLELACTGQIYFPAIAYMVQSGGGSGAQFFWLQLYNIAFILPLAVVLILVTAGVQQKSIQQWFSRHIAAGKLLMAVVFFLLTLLIWFSGRG